MEENARCSFILSQTYLKSLQKFEIQMRQSKTKQIWFALIKAAQTKSEAELFCMDVFFMTEVDSDSLQIE